MPNNIIASGGNQKDISEANGNYFASIITNAKSIITNAKVVSSDANQSNSEKLIIKPTITNDEAADRLINNNKWDKFTKNTVTYELDGDMPEDAKTQVRKSFESWNELINLEIREANFWETSDVYFEFGTPVLGEGVAGETGINNIFDEKTMYKGGVLGAAVGGAVGSVLGDIGATAGVSIGSALGSAAGYLYEKSFGDNSQTKITINKKYITDNKEGSYGFKASMHEIGHFLRFGHPSDYNNKEANYIADAQHDKDTKQFSIMSYFGAKDRDSDVNYGYVSPSTPMLHDVIAAQKFYGVNKNTRTGDDVYKFMPKFFPQNTINTSGSVERNEKIDPTEFILIPDHFLKENSDDSIRTIYDAGGNDTIDASSFDSSLNIIKVQVSQNGVTNIVDVTRDPVDQIISLESGTFSSIGYMKENVAITINANPENNTIIENAISADGDDIMIGNKANNYFETREGKDVVDATSGGADIIYDGKNNDHYVLDNNDTQKSDDILIFQYNEQNKDENFGDDTVYSFNPENDEIIIAGATQEREVFLEQDGLDTLVNYGSGTVRLVDVDVNDAKNAFKTTTPIISSQ